MFNSNQVNKISSEKHLLIMRDESLSFEEHLKLHLLRKHQNLLPRPALIISSKSFIRTYLDYHL